MKAEQSLSSLLLAVAPSFLAALFYCLVSGSMSFLNKVVLTSYKFNFPDVVMLAQVVVTSIIVEMARLLGFCDIQPWSLQRAKDFIIPSLCFAAYTILALSALSNLSIPIYNVLRRMLPLASLLMAIFILKKPPSKRIHYAIASIVLGTFLAGAGDLSFQMYGYLHALLSVCAQSLYLTYVQKTGVEKHLSALSVLHLNSINCILPLLLYTMWNNNIFKALQFDGLSDTSFTVTFLINICLGCVLNYSLFLCTTMNSALTTSVVGVAKGVITTIIGFFTFGGVIPTSLTVVGVTLNAIGGICYTYVRYQEKRQLLDLMKQELPQVPQSNGHTVIDVSPDDVKEAPESGETKVDDTS